MNPFYLAPTPINNASLWSSTIPVDYLLPEMAPPRPAPWPVCLYQPPLSSTDVPLWSEVHRYCLTSVKRVASKILPMGRRQGRIFRDAAIVVALRRCYVGEVGRWLQCGEWISLQTGAYGGNLVELYAYLNVRTYREAINVLAHEADLTTTPGDLRALGHLRHWSEERHPLHSDLEALCKPWCYPPHSEFSVYLNHSAHPILQSIRWRGVDGEMVRVYRTLLRHARSTECQWAEVAPRAPYPLFGTQLLQLHPAHEVVIVADEFLADLYNKKNWGFVFCAVPGGLANLPLADLGPLQGRQVRVTMDRSDLANGYRLDQALSKAGAATTWFSVGLGDTPRPFDLLEKVASEEGIALLPLPFDGTPTNESTVVLTSAGELIPSGDINRRMLITPIIREGYLVWLYAEPKIGKTWLALMIAYAAGRGNCSVGPWFTVDPAGVLYVDGEMLPDELQQSIRMVMAGVGDPPGPPPFATLCAQCQHDGVVDITSEHWQRTIEDALQGSKILILDNFQSLTDNGPAALNLVRPWFRKLARKGISVIVLDHTNRDGELQGSIAKERIANLSIALRYPDAQAKEEGRVLIEYPVARRLRSEDARPFEMRKIFTDQTFSFSLIAQVQSSAPKVREQVLAMARIVFAKKDEDLSYPEIKKKYGFPVSTAHGYYRAAEELSGDERLAFEAELRRLKAEWEPDAS